MDNPLLVLADHAAGWRGRALPPDLERHARRALIDWFACIFAGLGKPPASLLVAALPKGPGRAVCYEGGQSCDMRQAALLNAITAHTAEFDDIFRDAGYHPGSATVAAALAAAQEHGASLGQLLAAIVAAYDVGGRIALAVQPSHSRFWHPSATIGTMGAATAAAMILDLDNTKIANAIATAATMAGGLQQAFRSDGMAKPMHVGHAADAGCLAALSASAGITAAPDMLHGPVGFAAAASAEGTGKWDEALQGLGTRFLIGEMTFKNYGCCAHIFAALDGLRELQREHAFSAHDVVAIHVAGYGATKDVCDRPAIASEQEARFSLQYCAASLLLFGGVRLEAFTSARLEDPAIRALMEKISVSADPDAVAAYPRRRSAKVRVMLRGGAVLDRYQPTRKGDPDAPLSDDEVSEKFLELATPVLGAAGAVAWLDRLWTGKELPGAL